MTVELSGFRLDLAECLLITGQAADYQLKVMVKDLDAYQELLLKRITGIPGVSGVHTRAGGG